MSGLRLAFGLLTVLPAGSVAADRRSARTAVLAAPLVGLVLGGLAWAAGALLDLLGTDPLLSAVAAVGALAVLTRALHLDGLADLADGLGSSRPTEQALEVMRRSDAGPFGVVTLGLVLLAQVAALAQAWAAGLGAPALLVSAATARLALPWACRTGVPAARPDGLGALVAGTVPLPAAAAVTIAGALLAAAYGALSGDALGYGAAVLAGVGAAVLLLRRAVARLGGVTGDVLGALVETAATASLVVLVALAA